MDIADLTHFPRRRQHDRDTASMLCRDEDEFRQKGQRTSGWFLESLVAYTEWLRRRSRTATAVRHGRARDREGHGPALVAGREPRSSIRRPAAHGPTLVGVDPLRDMRMAGRRGDWQHLADRLDSIRFPMIIDERDHGLNRRSRLNLSGTAFPSTYICCGLMPGGPKECDHFSIKNANSCKVACAM
jgi:hypothetical protein